MSVRGAPSSPGSCGICKARKCREAEVGDIDERPAAQESAETLRVYRNGVPADERTTTVQEYFVVPAAPPTIATTEELRAKRAETVAYLRDHTFSHFPARPAPLDVEVEYERADGNANGGRFAFTSEAGWRLAGCGRQHRRAVARRRPWWCCARRMTCGGRATRCKRLLASTAVGHGSAWSREGTGDTGWSPLLDWHLRRAAMLTGRTIASLQVYDALRALYAVAELPGIDGRRLAIAGQEGMAAVALYAALLHGGLQAVCLHGPPATQDAPSQPDGTGEAIEMLFARRVTDLPQVAGLLWPAELVFIGPRPPSYQWTEELTRGSARRALSGASWSGRSGSRGNSPSPVRRP